MQFKQTQQINLQNFRVCWEGDCFCFFKKKYSHNINQACFALLWLIFVYLSLESPDVI